MERSCSCLKSLFPASPIVPGMGVLKGWGGGGHAGSSFLLPVRTLSGLQPELINSKRPSPLPRVQRATGLGWGAAGRWETENRRTEERTPPTHSLSLHTRKHSIPPAARAAHTTLPLFHTEAIINTCNNIFPAANSLLQIRTSHSCGGTLLHTRPPPLLMQTCTCHTVHTVHVHKSGL